jgi:hypothetical protein
VPVRHKISLVKTLSMGRRGIDPLALVIGQVGPWELRRTDLPRSSRDFDRLTAFPLTIGDGARVYCVGVVIGEGYISRVQSAPRHSKKIFDRPTVNSVRLKLCPMFPLISFVIHCWTLEEFEPRYGSAATWLKNVETKEMSCEDSVQFTFVKTFVMALGALPQVLTSAVV